MLLGRNFGIFCFILSIIFVIFCSCAGDSANNPESFDDCDNYSCVCQEFPGACSQLQECVNSTCSEFYDRLDYCFDGYLAEIQRCDGLDSAHPSCWRNAEESFWECRTGLYGSNCVMECQVDISVNVMYEYEVSCGWGHNLPPDENCDVFYYRLDEIDF